MNDFTQTLFISPTELNEIVGEYRAFLCAKVQEFLGSLPNTPTTEKALEQFNLYAVACLFKDVLDQIHYTDKYKPSSDEQKFFLSLYNSYKRDKKELEEYTKELNESD